MRQLVILLLTLFFPFALIIACELDAEDFIGYTIVSSHTVTGHINREGKEESYYVGCELGMVLIIDHNKQVTCAGYGYKYAYNPKMVLLSKGSNLKACIDDDVFDIMN